MTEADGKKQMAWFASMASTLYDVREIERVERSNRKYVAIFNNTGKGEIRSAELSGLNIRSRKFGKESLLKLNGAERKQEKWKALTIFAENQNMHNQPPPRSFTGKLLLEEIKRRPMES